MSMYRICLIIVLFFSVKSYTQNTNVLNTFSNIDIIQASPINYPIYEPFIKRYTNHFQSGLTNLKNQNKSLLQFIDYVLVTHGLPKQLKSLAIIESSLNNKTVSWVGAAGPWQFMPATARQYGLIVNDSIDERYDIYKSTYAAAKYLKQLYQRYGNWDLVIAAYNSGTRKVDKAIKKDGSTSFWDIQYQLPTETRNHVKKFIGTSYIIDGSTLHTFQPSSKISIVKVNDGFTTEFINAGFRLDVIAEQLNIALTEIQKWNPNFEQQLSKASEYLLKLPIDKMQIFLLHKGEILNLSIQKNIQFQ